MCVDLLEVRQLFDANHASITSSFCGNDSLLAGNLGLAYYYTCLYETEGVEGYRDQAVDILNAVLSRFTGAGGNLNSYTYSGGTAGLAYILTHMNRQLEMDLDLDSELEDLDEHLFSSAKSLLEESNMDSLHGAMGIIYYFSKRGAASYINELFPIVYRKKVVVSNGIWFTNLLEGLSTGVGEANLSVAHGLVGILLILLNCAPVLTPENNLLLKGLVSEGIRFILSYQQRPDFEKGNYAYFPPSVKVAENAYNPNCRLAWCYGDLGMVLLLYRASKLLEDNSYFSIADEIGEGTLRRKSRKESEINDIFFCHGTLGLVTFYKLLFKESGNTAYISGSDYWMEETIRRWRVNDLNSITDKINPHGLLDGYLGANLAALSYLNDKALTWANIFFL